MSNTALITGASGGIGAEFARIHARQGGDLILVARSADKLQALKDELESAHKVQVTTIAQDLSQPGAAQEVAAATQDAGLTVDILINNAGFGGHGKFHEREIRRDLEMIQLNIAALTELSHLFLQGMVERGHGQILNVASTAGFLPGPLQATYYATKAFVLSFSQAIAEELKGTGVSVTALCPGPVATGFVAAGDLDGVAVFDKAASAASVAEYGYKAMQNQKLVAINDFGLKFVLNCVLPFLPRKMVLATSRKSMEKSR